MLDKISVWERQIEEHERISGEKIADSVKCAVIQKGMPAALRTDLLKVLVNFPNASDWTAMRRSIQSHLLATASAPKPVPMDLGYLPWSNKGKGKDGKDKGFKGGDKGSWYNQQGGRGGKGKSKDKSGNGQGQGKNQGSGNAEHFARYCGKRGALGHILHIRFTVMDVLRPIIALSCMVQGGWDLSFGGAP
eukprot:4708496-Amphidinium_carterae.1